MWVCVCVCVCVLSLCICSSMWFLSLCICRLTFTQPSPQLVGVCACSTCFSCFCFCEKFCIWLAFGKRKQHNQFSLSIMMNVWFPKAWCPSFSFTHTHTHIQTKTHANVMNTKVKNVQWHVCSWHRKACLFYWPYSSMSDFLNGLHHFPFVFTRQLKHSLFCSCQFGGILLLS